MATSRQSRSRDPLQFGKLIGDIATGKRSDVADAAEDEGKNPAAVALGRLGALKGGKARAQKLSAERRIEIAHKAAGVRYSKK